MLTPSLTHNLHTHTPSPTHNLHILIPPKPIYTHTYPQPTHTPSPTHNLHTYPSPPTTHPQPTHNLHIHTLSNLHRCHTHPHHSHPTPPCHTHLEKFDLVFLTKSFNEPDVGRLCTILGQHTQQRLPPTDQGKETLLVSLVYKFFKNIAAFSGDVCVLETISCPDPALS